MHHSISPSEIPAVVRRRGAVLRATEAALLSFETARLREPERPLQQQAIAFLRLLGQLGYEVAPRRRRP